MFRSIGVEAIPGHLLDSLSWTSFPPADPHENLRFVRPDLLLPA